MVNPNISAVITLLMHFFIPLEIDALGHINKVDSIEEYVVGLNLLWFKSYHFVGRLAFLKDSYLFFN